MRRNSKLIIVLLILLISIGFAFLSSQLDLIGSSLLRKQEWDIHFESPTKVGGNVDASSLVLTDSTTVNFTVDLLQPKDTYEFTVDVVNDGSIDGMISSISGTELTSNQKKVFEYVITYDDGAALKEKQLLAHNSSDKYKVTVRYKDDISSSDLSIDNQTVNITITVNYVQADNTAFNRVSGSFVSLYNQTTPGVLAQGDEVNIGDEHFYIVDVGTENTIIFTKYPLNVGTFRRNDWIVGAQQPKFESGCHGCIPFAFNKYWVSDSTFISDYGTVPLFNDVYNSSISGDINSANYSAAHYVNNYITYLSTLGAHDITGKVPSYSEVKNYFGFDINTYSNFSNSPKWMYYPGYWLSSIWSSESTYSTFIFVRGRGEFFTVLYNYNSIDGVSLRVMITVPNEYI
ncbi:MAG: hypothetical protein Q4E69_03540 [Bacilli bacterium]|nr:hypothetical protein [Bacilli bacterium]